MLKFVEGAEYLQFSLEQEAVGNLINHGRGSGTLRGPNAPAHIKILIVDRVLLSWNFLNHDTQLITDFLKRAIWQNRKLTETRQEQTTVCLLEFGRVSSQ